MITTELTFALISFYFVMFVTPGPNNVMLFASGVKYGFKKTIPHIFGIPLGHFFQISLISMGLGFVFQTYPIAQQILKVLGCLYLFFLAYRMFGSLSIKESKETGRPLRFYEAALFQILNPKAWVVAITAVSVFFPKDESFLTGLFFLAGIAPLVNLPSISIWVLFGSSIRAFISNPKVKKIVEIVLAILLVLTGITILL
jgi:threonine/homoserine/homoserine lactone efflux protein